MVEPTDSRGQRRRLISYEFMHAAHRAMTPLEIGNRNLSFNRLEEMGLEIVSDPKPNSF